MRRLTALPPCKHMHHVLSLCIACAPLADPRFLRVEWELEGGGITARANPVRVLATFSLPVDELMQASSITLSSGHVAAIEAVSETQQVVVIQDASSGWLTLELEAGAVTARSGVFSMQPPPKRIHYGTGHLSLLLLPPPPHVTTTHPGSLCMLDSQRHLSVLCA